MIINNKPLLTGLRSVLFSSGLGLGHVKIVLNTDTIYTIEICPILTLTFTLTLNMNLLISINLDGSCQFRVQGPRPLHARTRGYGDERSALRRRNSSRQTGRA